MRYKLGIFSSFSNADCPIANTRASNCIFNGALRVQAQSSNLDKSNESKDLLHYNMEFFNNITGKRSFTTGASKRAHREYGQSKLACLLFGDELDRRLRTAGRKTKALSVHPGGSESGLFHNVAPDQLAQMKAQVDQFLHSPEEAAKPTLHAALSPDVAGGDYFGPIGPREMSGEIGQATRDPITQDIDIAKRLWCLSEEMTNQTFLV